MAELPSGTVTFLFTDIEGSTQLLKRFGALYGELLAQHQRIIREAATARGGREIDTQGDSFFFAFARANAALGAAVVAQRALAEHDWPEGGAVRVRMGLHTGEPVVGEERYVGLGVHRAARIGAIGHGGQVLLSNATRELVENDVEGVTVRELGEYRLKDIDRPERLYQLDIEGLPSAFPPLRAHRIAAPRAIRQRTLLLAGLAGVLAAAVAVPIFAFGQGGSGGGALESAAGNSLAFVDAASSDLVADVAVGTTPTDVAVGEGAAWVTNAGDGTVDRVDLDTQTVRQTIRVGDGPDGVAVGAGGVWVANGLDGTVSRIDPSSNEITQEIAVGNGPSGIAVGRGGVWVVCRDDRTLTRIDPVSGELERTFPVGQAPVDVAIGSGSIWVSSEADGKVLRLDSRTGSVLDAVPVGRAPGAIATGAGAVWVVNTADGTVSRIDAETSSVTATVEVGDAPAGVAVGSDAVWVASEGAGTLSRIDPETNRVTETIELGSSPVGLAAGDAGVLAAVRPAAGAHRGGTLTVVNDGWLDWGSLDPAVGMSPVVTLTNDGLTSFRHVGGRQSTQVVPNLALSVPQPTNAGRTYTFRVRKGIRYSTGGVVRARDFRHALERNFDVEGDFAYLWETIVGADRCARGGKRCDLSKGIVEDEQAGTVTFHLTEPDPDLPAKLALPLASAVPEDAPRRRMKPAELAATGPYRVAAYLPQRQIRLVRNPRFREWSRAAAPDGYPDEIVIKLDVPVPAQIRAIRRGAADVADISNAGLSDTGEIAGLKARLGSRLRSGPLPVGVYLWLNTRIPPFDDVRVRKALNLAVDRDAVIRAAGGADVAAATCQILPANFPGYRPYCPYEPDVAAARRLVAASGTRGMSVSVWARRSYGPVYAQIVRALRVLGYRARLRLVADPEYIATVNRSPRNAIHAGWAGWIPDYPTAGSYLTGMLAYFKERGAFSHRSVDREIARALELQQTDPAAADEIWARVDRLLVDRAAFVPLYNLRGVVLVSERAGNFQFHPLWFTLLDQLWVR